MLAARLGDKGPAPCRAGPPGLTHSPSWAQRPAGRLALGGASPGRVCPGQGPRGPSLRVPWRLRLAPRSLLSHLADPAKPLPLPTCSQVELVPAGCPGSCLLAPAVGFPGAPRPVPSPGKGLHPGTGEPQGLPRLCPTPWGPAAGGGRGSFFSPHQERSCRHPRAGRRLVFTPGLGTRFVFSETGEPARGASASGRWWEAAARLRGQTWVGGQAGPPAGPRASSLPVRSALPALGHPAPERLSNLRKVTQGNCRAVVSAPAPVVARGPRPVPRA